MVRVWKILLAGRERAYLVYLQIFSRIIIYLKRSDCNGCQKLEGFVCQELLPPSHG